ncbi:PEP-CTERM sorting domain-containing protein [Roseateles chitinivorans]|uniref:PEP-CTERM sorting domain-containing protein n=1 Tax=Roseateles chitinivorans TaxID=2917965 RepID=UPI003D668361
MRKPFARSLSALVTHGITRACLPLVLAVAAPFVSATVVTFDDLGDDGFVPAHYAGLDWSASSWFQYAGEQAPYTPHSGDRRATLGFDGSSATSAIGFLTPSTYQGAWFSGFDGVSVAVDLYLGGALVASTSLLNLSDSPAFLGSGYAGLVDRLVFRSNDPAFFVMDDLTFASAVPEPASGALALGGLAVAALVIRRRKAASSSTVSSIA